MMHKISQAYMIVLAYGKPFITELFEEPSYVDVYFLRIDSINSINFFSFDIYLSSSVPI